MSDYIVFAILSASIFLSLASFLIVMFVSSRLDDLQDKFFREQRYTRRVLRMQSEDRDTGANSND